MVRSVFFLSITIHDFDPQTPGFYSVTHHKANYSVTTIISYINYCENTISKRKNCHTGWGFCGEGMGKFSSGI